MTLKSWLDEGVTTIEPYIFDRVYDQMKDCRERRRAQKLIDSDSSKQDTESESDDELLRVSAIETIKAIDFNSYLSNDTNTSSSGDTS